MVRERARSGARGPKNPCQPVLCGMRVDMFALMAFVLLTMSGSVLALDLQARSSQSFSFLLPFRHQPTLKPVCLTGCHADMSRYSGLHGSAC